MDDSVLRAMARWPNVPAAFGWLSLDMRGRWLLRQERVGNARLIEFIGRNYGSDASGRWFFQNGPQRVFATLAYAPLVLRLVPGQYLITHTAKVVRVISSAWMDREGIVTLHTEHGAGTVDDRDIESLAPWISDATGRRPPEDLLTELLESTQEGRDCGIRLRYGGRAVALRPLPADETPNRLGFVRIPRPLPEKGADC
ncbi:MAG: DUF2946 family protein [Burkholderiales bacterium]|nr:DUF2946 family protein [Burkholderiales bacterium]